MKPISLFFLMTFLILACSGGKKLSKKKSAKDPEDEILLISIEQSPCLGKCPHYKAQFYSGRKLYYEGYSHMPVLGRYEYLLPQDLTKNLMYEAVKMNLKTVPDSMPCPPDVSVIHLTVNLNGKYKRMVGWIGFGNEIFNNYVKLVHGEVKAMVSEQEGLKMN